MYRYYQTDEHSTWLHLKDDASTMDRAKAAGARKLTILAVSEVINDETTDKHNLSYKGPFYVDIDCKDDLNQAIVSARILVDRLRALDVPEMAIEVVASGSKGIHVMVPACIFSSGRPLKNLPLIYREMALELHVLGLDFQVYSQGRGVSWRIHNVRRNDGNYPVPITVEELRVMDAEGYRRVVSQPRPHPIYDYSGIKAPGLEALFERAKKRVKAKPQVTQAVPDEDLIKIRDVTPQCVEDLCNYRVKGDVNYNQSAMQLAAYAARAGVAEDKWKALCSRMSENANSSQYSTPRLRFDHSVGVVRYSLSNKGVKFSCNAMRSVLANRPCEGCTLYRGETSDQDAGLELGITEKSDGYYILGEKSDRRISTFLLEPINVFIEEPQGGGQPIRRSTEMRVLRNGESLGTIRFDEGSWGSRSSFNKELQGIGNLSFVGTDLDVQRIKHVVYEEGREMGEVTQVKAAGIHLHKIGRREVRVYVEPGYSYNQLQVEGTHTMTNTIAVPPLLKEASIPAHGDPELTAALTALLEVNRPEIIAQILGWCSIAHLKTQIQQRYAQFPLLSLWGNAGSGKNKTAELFCWLNGVNYGQGEEGYMLPPATPFSVLAYCSSTTTVPRILDEYNKSKIAQRLYDYFGDIMKASWNGSGPGRGVPAAQRGNVPEIVLIKITSPLIILSEQAPGMPALQQRSVQIMLSRQLREGRDDYMETAERMREHLHRMAKAMMGMSLRTDIQWIEERLSRYRDVVPKVMEDRPRYSYQLLLVGLDFFAKALRELGIPLTEKVRELKDALIGMLEEQGQRLAQEKARTEVDAVMETLGIMITLANDSEMPTGQIKRFKHFATDDEYLYLDLPIVHALYSQYMIRQRQSVVIEDGRVFEQLLKQEPYYVGEVLKKTLVQTRKVVQLSLKKMAAKGHRIDQYEG